MATVESYDSFLNFLRDEFDKRTAKNARYSLRAFARDLGLSPSRLSEILSGEANISAHSAAKICDVLGLSASESRYLVDLATLHVSRSVTTRSGAERRMRARAEQNEFAKVNSFETLLSKWYYLPLIEFFTLPKPVDAVSVQRQLGLSATELQWALTELEQRNLISKKADGSWERVSPLSKFESSARSETIRRFHQDYLQLAKEAVVRQPSEKRKFLTSVLTFSSTDLDDARAELEAFSAAFMKKYARTTSGDSVFAFAIQFYELGAQNESHSES